MNNRKIVIDNMKSHLEQMMVLVDPYSGSDRKLISLYTSVLNKTRMVLSSALARGEIPLAVCGQLVARLIYSFKIVSQLQRSFNWANRHRITEKGVPTVWLDKGQTAEITMKDLQLYQPMRSIVIAEVLFVEQSIENLISAGVLS